MEEIKHETGSYELGSSVGLAYGLQDRAYSRIINLLIRNERAKWAQLVVGYIEQQGLPESLHERAKQIIGHFFEANRDNLGRVLDVDNVTSAIERIDEKTLSDHFLTNDVQSRWGIVKNSSLIGEIFGEEAFSKLEKDLVDISLGRLLQAQAHTERSVNLGYRLFWLARENSSLRVGLTPFLIMNSWREPGYSGEKPFVSIHLRSDETMLYKFVASLTEEELSQLRKQNIPGLMQVVDTVLSYPTTFKLYRVDSPDWLKFKKVFERKEFITSNQDRPEEIVNEYQNESDKQIWDNENQRWVTIKDAVEEVAREAGVTSDITKWENWTILNPPYQSIQQGLAQISLTLMRDGNEAKQFFVMELFRQISDVELGEGYDILKNILIRSNNRELQDELLRMVISRVGRADYGDFRAVLVLLENFQHVPSELQGKIHKKGHKFLLGFLGRKLEDDHIELLSQVLNKNFSRIKAAINFINEVNDLCGSSYDAESLEDYIELAHQEGVVEIIRELSNYGYRFYIGHSKVLREMVGQREKIVRAIEEVRKLFPDFKYTLAEMFQRNPETQEMEIIYVSDPHEIFAIRNPIEEFLKIFHKSLQLGNQTAKKFSDGLLRSLNYQLVAQGYPVRSDDDFSQAFYEDLELLSNNFNREGSSVNRYKGIFTNVDFFLYLVRNPQRIQVLLDFADHFEAVNPVEFMNFIYQFDGFPQGESGEIVQRYNAFRDAGLHPMAQLFNSSLTLEELTRQAVSLVHNGGFNINNNLHLALNYSNLRMKKKKMNS